MDAHTHSYYALYNRAYFAGLFFAVRPPLKNFPLYSIHKDVFVTLACTAQAIKCLIMHWQNNIIIVNRGNVPTFTT